ncbi:uncharacterized protein LOC134282197 [Saccostrea cucullata]|uniref:uncharacterized protein LOC134282197 n=1 Tax=Saccostrea cuccullata TaxID=36930 RepID=UPI002ED4F1F2
MYMKAKELNKNGSGEFNYRVRGPPWARKVVKLRMIEGVQRRATKQIPGLAKLSYEERLKKLKLPTLKYRRHRGDMIEVYKITSGKYDPLAADFIKLRRDHVTREQGRGNSKKLFVQRPRLNIRKFSFSVRTVSLWNSLPEDVVSAKTLNTFKNRLDNFWKDQDVLYNYKVDFKTDYTGSNPSSHKASLESDEEDLDRTCVGKIP